MVQDILLANNFNFRTNSVAIRATSSPLILGQSFLFSCFARKKYTGMSHQYKKKKKLTKTERATVYAFPLQAQLRWKKIHDDIRALKKAN